MLLALLNVSLVVMWTDDGGKLAFDTVNLYGLVSLGVPPFQELNASVLELQRENLPFPSTYSDSRLVLWKVQFRKEDESRCTGGGRRVGSQG